MKKKQEPELRKSFLIGFVESLIENSATKGRITATANQTTQTLPQIKIKPITQERRFPQPSIKEIPQEQKMMPSVAHINEDDAPFAQERKQTIPKINLPSIKQQQKPNQPETPPINKIIPLLKDPGVSSIECQGPGKNLIINKQGVVQAISLRLAENEIKEILKEFSNKTKIPLIKGVFRAVLGNLLISAVISEFIGTRFHIEKKLPTQSLPMPWKKPQHTPPRIPQRRPY